MQSLLNFFSSIFQDFGRTKKQKLFEERLYNEGLQKEQTKIIHLINQSIPSKEIARKFMLQELDILRQGDTTSQSFTETSGFHRAEYLGASKKFEDDKKSIEMAQNILIDFLEQISNEKRMLQSAQTILNGVMQHWEIGKYSQEGKIFIEENEIKQKPSLKKESKNSSLLLSLKNLQTVVMNKLIYLDDQIQKLLDTFSEAKTETMQTTPPKEETKKPKTIKKSGNIYNDKKIYELMEEYTAVIEELITGGREPKNYKTVSKFQEHISLALLEGNNLASVFYPFFDSKNFENLSFPIVAMDDNSKKFFIDILNTFQKQGFSKHLHHYLQENQEAVYALATKNDMFMQYLIAFWYAPQNENAEKREEEQIFWYQQSALNGFKPAIKKLEMMGF